MKRAKDFDCVEMKWDIQQRLLAEFHGMSREEVREDQHRRIAADSLLGPFLRKVPTCSPTPTRSCD